MPRRRRGPARAVQQLKELGDIGDPRVCGRHTVKRPWRAIPACYFTPKCQAFPLQVCFISGSRAAIAFFVELGAAMIVASTIVPLVSSNGVAVSSSLTVSKIAAVR